MYKHILHVALASLFILPATGQVVSHYRKLYADPKRPGILLDSMQIKILEARQKYILKEISRMPVSLNKTKPAQNASTLSNVCNVKASFTPGNDTTLYTGQGITFTNTSQNADSYEWIVDSYLNYTTNDLINYVPAVGITPVLLVAQQGACTDTAIT